MFSGLSWHLLYYQLFSLDSGHSLVSLFLDNTSTIIIIIIMIIMIIQIMTIIIIAAVPTVETNQDTNDIPVMIFQVKCKVIFVFPR